MSSVEGFLASMREKAKRREAADRKADEARRRGGVHEEYLHTWDEGIPGHEGAPSARRFLEKLGWRRPRRDRNAEPDGTGPDRA